MHHHEKTHLFKKQIIDSRIYLLTIEKDHVKDY